MPDYTLLTLLKRQVFYRKAIDKHEKIADGVYKTTFEGGKAVVVNYNYSNYQYNGQEIAARDFAAVKGGEE